MKKVYARTVAPEYSDPSIYRDYENDDIVIYGNKSLVGFNEHVAETAVKLVDDLYYDDAYDACSYDKADGSEFTEEEFAELTKIAKDNTLSQSETEEAFLIAFISLYYGKDYKKVTLRGYCQGDWQYAYVPADSSNEYVDEVECLYFNLGTEVLIDTEHSYDDDTEVSPDDFDGYYAYVTSCDEDKIKNFVAWEQGVKPEDVVLYLFDGWKRTPTYRAC